jgi:hypothetical protein
LKNHEIPWKIPWSWCLNLKKSESRAADLPRLNDTEDSFEPPGSSWWIYGKKQLQVINIHQLFEVVDVTNFDLFGAYVPKQKKKEILRWSKPLELEGALLFLSGFEAHSRCFGACIQPPKHRLWKMWPQGVCTMTSVMRRNVGRSSERMGMERMVLTR